MDSVSITAVIPNWNGRGRLSDLLGDLKSQTQPPGAVLVIDNGSTDGSDHDAVTAGARVIRFAENRGFAAAVNEGVRQSQTDLVAILNNDLRLAPEWMARMMERASADGISFAVGKLLNSEDRSQLDGCFDAICRGGCSWRCGKGRTDGPLWTMARTVILPPFTAVVVRRDYYMGLGGLDEAFGSYLEDVEFGLRSASKGYTGTYVPEAVGYHEGSGTLGAWSPRVVRQIARNQMLILARHYPNRLLLRFGWAIAVSHLLWGLVALRHGAGLAWLLGKIDGARLFASHRRVGHENIGSVLGSSEKELLDLQKQAGWDTYWRIYAALT